MVIFGIVVIVTVTVTTGRRAGKKIHLFILWPMVPQRIYIFYDGRKTPFFFLTIFVNELVIINSQSITSFVVKFTVVKKIVTFITVVVIPFSPVKPRINYSFHGL